MLALKDFESKCITPNIITGFAYLMLHCRYNSSSAELMSELARNFVDLQSQLAAAVCRVTIHVRTPHPLHYNWFPLTL